MIMKKNLIGQKFGRLTVISEYGRYKKKQVQWLCKYECGNTVIATTGSLNSGNTTSCGCYNRSLLAKDLTNKVFGKLTAIKVVGRNKHKSLIWECLCECGNKCYPTSNSLLSGNTKSCGCVRRKKNSEKMKKANFTHGKTYTRLYNIWCAMKGRCYRHTNDHYSSYGERGIEVCNEWKNDFQSFYDWAINNGYNENLTIDRIDNNKGYSPENCQWLSFSENTRKQRRTVFISVDGKCCSVSGWAKIIGVGNCTVRLFYNRFGEEMTQKAIHDFFKTKDKTLLYVRNKRK